MCRNLFTCLTVFFRLIVLSHKFPIVEEDCETEQNATLKSVILVEELGKKEFISFSDYSKVMLGDFHIKRRNTINANLWNLDDADIKRFSCRHKKDR
jgi:hypothetical protein